MTEANPRLLEMDHTDLAILADQWRRQAIYYRQEAAELNQRVQAQRSNTPNREKGRTIIYRDPTGNQATDQADKRKAA